MDLLLVFSKHDETASLGICELFEGDNRLFKSYCLALPYKNNRRNISRIQDGEYDAIVVDESYNFKYPHICINNIQGRSAIKIHAGNIPGDIKGCFLVGTNNDGNMAVWNSRNTLKELMECITCKRFRVIVKTI